ncbi:uncharacterized protein [Dermacentor albipictus]|uniref:uncharacterized protein n=1 Tax=Dermacentor albipictus TaxID=60249 RepID=UPI0038FC1D22
MRVAVIGAGCAGITAVKACLEENLDVVCFEAASNSGGLWWYRDEEHEDVFDAGTVMRFTVCNTSKEMCVYSDFPPNKDWPIFLGHKRMLQYIRDYADHFRVTPRIRFRHKVVDLSEDLTLRVRNLETGEEFEESFDRVMICTGHHAIPSVPVIAGRSKFKGRVMHSREYKYTDESIRGKRVVIVGFGNSAVDIAVDVADVAEVVFLSIRRANWVVPRHHGGVPIDVVFSNQLHMFMYEYLPTRLSSWFMQSIANSAFNHKALGLEPQHQLLAQYVVINSTLPEKVLSGQVKFRGEIEAFTEHGVIMDNAEEPADLVIFATGTRTKYLSPRACLLETRTFPCSITEYFPPEYPRVAFIGFVDVNACVLMISEMQARYAVQVFTDKLTLPTSNTMLAELVMKMKNDQRFFVPSPRHAMMVDPVTYIGDLATTIGVRPNFRRMLYTDPWLFFAAVRAPTLNYKYRLEGPHAWPGARDAILGYETRMKAPLKPPAILVRSDRKRLQITLVTVVLLIVVLCLAVMLTSEFPLFSAVIWCAGALDISYLESQTFPKMRVAVIGAGCCGITAVKACLEEGLDVVCFEKASNCGGLWWYREETPETGTGTVMRFTVANTSKEMSCYSDFPPDREVPLFMTHWQTLRYIRSYADHFGVTPRIRFNHEVLRLDKDGTVRIRDTAADREWEGTFDAVLVCCGHHGTPLMPDVPGRELFRGRVMHSRDYKDVDERVRDKNAVVVGCANSAIDVAVNLASVARQVFLSTRRVNWILPNHYRGTPLDEYAFKQLRLWLYSWLPRSYYSRFLTAVANETWDHKMFGLEPSHDILTQGLVVNNYIQGKLLDGTVKPRGAPERFTETGVVMDGVEEEVDTVVFATGFKADLPFPTDALPRNGERFLLYKMIVPPDNPNVAFLGFIDASSNMLQAFEMQGRYMALVLSGKLRLPSREAMKADVEATQNKISSAFIPTTRHALMIDRVRYVDDLAGIIGVRPSFFKLLITDPKLYWTLITSPLLNYKYRLRGPHSWGGARDAILGYKDRMRAPLTRPEADRKRPFYKHHFTAGMVAFVAAATYLGAWYLGAF